MAIAAPLIDERTFGDLVAELEALAAKYTGEVAPVPGLLEGRVLAQTVAAPGGTSFTQGTRLDQDLAERLARVPGLALVKVVGWLPPGPDEPPDAGAVLLRLFARMAELVVARLNRVPDKSFLAFLDLIGTRLGPPQPARVPLTFHLAAGSPNDALVPAGTQVAAPPLAGEKAPVLYATERDLVVTRSRLAAAAVREPGRDRWSDRTDLATGRSAGSLDAFRGESAIEHILYLGDAGRLGNPPSKDVVLRIGPADPAWRWPSAVAWERWGGGSWSSLPDVKIESEGTGTAQLWKVTLSGVPPLPPSVVGGRGNSWLRGRLATPLPHVEPPPAGNKPQVDRRGLAPDALFSAGPAGAPAELALHTPFRPFGSAEEPRQVFYLAAEEVFSKPGAQVEIDLTVVTDPDLPQGNDLPLTWEYWNGAAWAAVPGIAFDGRPFLGATSAVHFTAPADWLPTGIGAVPEIGSHWLRVRAASGVLGARPPLVATLLLGYTWQLPWIDTLTLSTSIHQDANLTPELGLANQSPLDLTRDFFPFGEKPRVGDVLYLASDEVFSREGASVTLHIVPTNSTDDKGIPPKAGPSKDLALEWEFWSGRSWQTFGRSGPGAKDVPVDSKFTDGSKAFTVEGDVTFTCPNVGTAVVGGEKRRFIRVRIVQGNYGVEVFYEEIQVTPAASQAPILSAARESAPAAATAATVSTIPAFKFVPASFKPPSLRAVRLGYDISSAPAPPQELLTVNDFAVRDLSPAAFVPLVLPRFVVGGGFTDFLPAAAMVERAGRFLPPAAEVVGAPFLPPRDSRPTLYLGFERPGDTVGFANRATTLYCGVEEPLYDPAVQPRAAAEAAAVVWEYWNGGGWQRLGTRDETQALTRRGLVTFIGPADFRASSEFDRTAFWLRIRWERGEYAIRPRLRRIFTGTVWAENAQTVSGEVLGSSRGERGLSLHTRLTPVLPGQQLEVREPELPAPEDRAALAAEEGDDAVRVIFDTAGQPAEIWMRWHEVPDFYASGPRSRHYTLDRASGEVRFGDGRRGLVPPPGAGNLRMAAYRVGGGTAGNRPAGSINQIKGTVPYVDGVSQPEPADGGAPAESLDSVRVHGPRRLRHRDRATALADCEDLAFAAAGEVARVQGIGATGGSDAGAVGLLVVPRSADPKPVPSLELLERVRAYLAARLSPVADLWVAGPDWLRIDVEAEVVPRVLEQATDVQNAVLARLAAFLHPLTGGSDGAGWAFGRKPYRSDLYALIAATPGLDYARFLRVAETPEQGEARAGRFLIFSGNHQITLSSGAGDAAGGGSAP